MRAFSLSFCIPIAMAVAALPGCNPSGESQSSSIEPNKRDAPTNTASSDLLRDLSRLANRSGFVQTDQGVWTISSYALRDSNTKLTFLKPIELLHRQQIAKNLTSGKRPDGEAMYSYLIDLPSWMPPEWTAYAIDIFPNHPPSEDSIDSGNLFLYGHLVKPPYKLQIAVVDENDIRLLLNGVDLNLPTSERLHKSKHINRIRSVQRMDTIFRNHIQQVTLTLLLFHPTQTVARTTDSMLKTSPHVFDIVWCDHIDDCGNGKFGLIRYSWKSKNILRMAKSKLTKPEIFASILSNCPKHYIFLEGFDTPQAYRYLGQDATQKKTARSAQLSELAEAAIYQAWQLQQSLSTGRTSVVLNSASRIDGISPIAHGSIVDACNMAKHSIPDSIAQLKTILVSENTAIRVLANCSR